MNITLALTTATIAVTDTVSGLPLYTIVVPNIENVKPHDISIDQEGVRRDDFTGVSITMVGGMTFKFAIRDIEAGVTYATSTALYNAIQAVL